MKAKGGKFTHSRTRNKGCSRSLGCNVCGRCVSYLKYSAKCHACYPRFALTPTNCECWVRGTNNEAYMISQKIDKPMYDVNGQDWQTPHIYNDPLDKMVDALNGAEVQGG